MNKILFFIILIITISVKAQQVEITGASISAVNGTYTFAGIYDGVNYYTKGSIYLARTYSQYWGLATALIPDPLYVYYYVFDNSAIPNGLTFNLYGNLGYGSFPTSTYSPAVSVTVTRDLSFGSFSTGSSGGTVSWAGTRTATGTIFLVDTDPGQSAIIRLTAEGPVELTTQVTEQLTNGTGGLITLEVDYIIPSFPLSVTGSNDIYVGGTLTVGPPAVSPSGNYSGSFEVTFNYQ